LNNSLARFAGAVTAALVLASCGKTTPITSGTASPPPPYTPIVSNEYAIPTANSSPQNIVAGASALYFTEEAADQIGELSTSAVITEFPLPTSNAKPLSITYGADGNLWFTEYGAAKIGKVAPSGVSFLECALPAQGATTPTPWGIAAANDGTLWVTDPGSNGIWSVTTSCAATFYPLLTANAGPESIAPGPNGAMWFVETTANKIGEIAPGQTNPSEFPITAGAGASTIVSGSDNAVYFTETATDKLGRMLASGALASETTLTGMTAPYGLVLGADGNFYIGDKSASIIGQYNTVTGVTTTYPTKTANAGVMGLSLGPGSDREVYFVETTANKIGQFRYY
jgi:virginiamycin B lyase